MQIVVSVDIICTYKNERKKYELGGIFLKYNILMFQKTFQRFIMLEIKKF